MLEDSTVRDAVLESFVYSPMRSFFTFGYGGLGNDKDQLKYELNMDELREKLSQAYTPDRMLRNKYPGLEETKRRYAEQAERRKREEANMIWL